MPIERPCATLYLSAIAMFALSVTVCDKILTCEMCIPLEWAKVRFRYANRKDTCAFLRVGNSNVCHIYHRLRDNHVWKSRRTRFEFWTLKFRVKDVENLDEDEQWTLSCQPKYAWKTWRVQVHPFVRGTYSYNSWMTYRRTDEWTYRHTAR